MKTEITTTSGFKCELEKERLDDWEFARIVAAVEKDEGKALDLCIFMMDRVLDPETAERLQEHVRTEDGRVPTSALMQELTDIINGTKSKN